MIHIDLCHSIPTLSQRYKLRVVPYEDDYDKIMEVYQSLGTKFGFLIGCCLIQIQFFLLLLQTIRNL